MKMLSRSEIDKLLERDKMGRPATQSEIQLLQKEIEQKKDELGMNKNEKLPKQEIQKIIVTLGLQDVEIMLF